MPKRKLRVIPMPPEGSRVVIIQRKDGTAMFAGKGALDLVCGGCGHKLAKSLTAQGQPRDMVLVCSACGAANDTEDAPN